jgi:outer membrane murein-binding lipoprotein Lpp
MQIDQNKFMNAVVENTNAKLNQLQSQVILLETQLHFAIQTNAQLQEELDKLKKKKEKQEEFTNPS